MLQEEFKQNQQSLSICSTAFLLCCLLLMHNQGCCLLSLQQLQEHPASTQSQLYNQSGNTAPFTATHKLRPSQSGPEKPSAPASLLTPRYAQGLQLWPVLSSALIQTKTKCNTQIQHMRSSLTNALPVICLLYLSG